MRYNPFELICDYKPTGDQPAAIEQLLKGIERNMDAQTLLGVTGSGKTFTMANVIATLNRPTLIISHNKTLAAQLYSEFKEFFPNNAVEYFISYYDYYQPEAYIAATDTYIEKEVQINDDIDRMRHSATRNLFERRDVIVVASVSCIYGLGLPENYLNAAVRVAVGDLINQKEFLLKLVENQYTRCDLELKRSGFRLRGDVIEIQPAYDESILRLAFFGDELEQISVVSLETGEVLELLTEVVIYPAIHYVTQEEDRDRVFKEIIMELQMRTVELESQGKAVEAQRLNQRVRRDLEMIKEIGYCNGIENYSRVFEGRKPGTPPRTLLDYFPKDFLMFIDESHVTVPQLKGMYHGDQSRKNNLIDYGFRLPCARDNRPLNDTEFWDRVGQHVFVSATPAHYELEHSNQVVEQIIRPTGLLDPEIEIVPTQHQVDHLLEQITERVDKGDRVLITTLTKRMAEDLCEYYKGMNLRVRYLHSDIKPLERVAILRDLRNGEFDVLIGVNLLREGLDLPEVSLVAIMDADKEGFLRSESSLIQTIGRAARNDCGKVILYADKITDSMQRALDTTNARRDKQIAYNKEHGITPKTIKKKLTSNLLDLVGYLDAAETDYRDNLKQEAESVPKEELPNLIAELEFQMQEAAKMMAFEKAAKLRDQLQALQSLVK